MRVMALDIGEVRIGVAISDPERVLASPVCVVSTKEVLGNHLAFRRLIEDWEPELFLCGMPYTLEGKEGPQAKNVRAVAKHISQTYSVPLEFVDERLSSQEAKRNLREEGRSEKEMRGKIDMIAASLFLQTWLDSQRAR